MGLGFWETVFVDGSVEMFIDDAIAVAEIDMSLSKLRQLATLSYLRQMLKHNSNWSVNCENSSFWRSLACVIIFSSIGTCKKSNKR